MNWRFISYASADPAWNMAVDEAIFNSYLQKLVPPTIRFYGWKFPTLSVGYFQDIEKEINLLNLFKSGLGLVRRNTGGRAVLHHQELTYSVVAGTADGLPERLIDSYLYISRALVDAFTVYGIQAELHEGAIGRGKGTGACFEAPSWYEITVAGRKLVGSAQLRQNNSFLQHGSILIDFSAMDLGSILNLQEMTLNEWAEKMEQKVTSFKKLGLEISPLELTAEILRSFEKLYNLTICEASLTQAEVELANRLVSEKYANDQWNFLRGSSGNRARIIGQ